MFEPNETRGFGKVGQILRMPEDGEEHPFFIVRVLKREKDLGLCYFTMTHVEKRVFLHSEFVSLLLKFEFDQSPPFQTWIFRGIDSKKFV
jgi:hypothetical protein